MKLNYFLGTVISLICLTFLVNCGNTKNLSNTVKQSTEMDTIVIENDSLDYKIVIIDIGFNGWLVSQRERGFYQQKFMERRNWQYVTEYNSRARNQIQFSDQLYPFEIDYDVNTDYGYEVNYLLYHYFLFFEEKYNQKLR